ncbi:hypothetical protein KHS38_15790 [Mucilaginibacter sp. Bleaf8]|uniref:hypothetical protein n=1 Tax=Mucilaginibacter sp. Bleaf8 TaxID=2834430 RepID=UPI001BCA946A|nr:hypothetical protein [Mucilaginibacter sp. Bleaf8]MBS7565870.1 hypothetical protein [Mucilaginibacter sp. Bleaf8]
MAAITDSIQTEGKLLYRSEMASWYGTDVFMEKLKHRQPLSGGYLSYDTGKGVNNIFFGKGDDPEVLATISFNYDFDLNSYKLDTASRKLNETEKELFTIRRAALSATRTDTLFKRYNNTGTNLIPVVGKRYKRVYILTSPEQSGYVILGNDYQIDFDKNNNITSKRKIHKSIFVLQTQGKEVQTAGMHSHLPTTGEFMTVTDVCTLALYGKYTTWDQYYTISKDCISIWDIKKQLLVIMTMKAWKRIGNDVGKSSLNPPSH